MRRLVKVIFLSIVFFYLSDTMALGKIGHRVVGKIAENHLTATAKAAVKSILGDDSLAEVSTWPDFMRSNAHPFWKRYSTPWHYVSIAAGKNYQTSAKSRKGDIYVAINAFIDILSDKPLKNSPVKAGLTFYFGDLNSAANKVKIKQFALKFLVHLIGDLHQPLHTGHKTDQGGNRIKVQWFGQPTNLHTVWDSTIIDSSQLSYTEMVDFIDIQDVDRIKQIQNSSVLDWLNESLKLRKNAYKIGNKKFGYHYYYKNYPIMQQQMLKAGLRLAATLNGIFSKK